MSHVDEGQLHAYLDGGLSAMDAVKVERHLADCAPCRQRLEEARRLVQRAAKLLEWASPPERAAPPLADLQPTAPRWRTPVAWAATIVVALGIGLYGGNRLLQHAPEAKLADERAHDATRAAAEPVAPPVAAPTDSGRLQQRDSAPQLARAAESRPAATPETETAAAAAPAPQPKRDSAVTTTGAAGVLAAAPPDSALRRQQDAQRTDSLRALVDNVTVGAANALRPSADSVAQRERREPALAPAPVQSRVAEAYRAPADSTRVSRNFPTATTWPIISRDSAGRLLRGPLAALPDFPIMNVRGSNDAVIVEHVLPPGQIVRLVERRARAEEAAGARANELLARYVGDLRVEISGPFSADSLNRLLEKVRTVP
jgi:hypothetical protein